MSIVFLLCAVQFINILDFMMVMPLGPQFAGAIGVDPSHIGLIAGSYTASAAISGLLCSSFLDRFDRKKALLTCFAGLIISTVMCSFSFDLLSMVFARVCAGAFGGPATALCFAIISDRIPVERRGRALGVIMMSFSLASIIGVPAGLELAQRGNWQTPFFAVGILGAVVLVAMIFLLPAMKDHLVDGRASQSKGVLEAIREMIGLLKTERYASAMTATSMMMIASFLVVPNIATFVQINMEYPSEKLGALYMIGGISSFFSMHITGYLVDRFGGFWISLFGTVGMMTSLLLCFVIEPPVIPAFVIFVTFMVFTSMRNMSFQTVASRIPEPHQRARFMSLQSAVQHFSTSAGALISSAILITTADNKIGNMPIVASMSLLVAVFLPFQTKKIMKIIG
jgi:predicted MFS family arabinose efflux permease